MRLLLTLLLTTLIPLLADGQETLAADEPLNVLFIAADDLNTTLGCYGDRQVQTPHIDRLAAEGLLFERAYCQQAVCNPTRASLLSGRRPDTIRVWNLRADFRTAIPDAVTLPQHFKQNGYHTQAIGKIYHNMGDLDDEPSWSVSAQLHAGRHADDYSLPEHKGKGKPTSVESPDAPDNIYRDGQITDLAVEAIADLAEQPFFLAVGYWRPHLPFLAPQKYWDRYDAAALTLPSPLAPPEDVPAIALHDSRELRGYGVKQPFPLPEDVHRELLHGYLASITYLDAQIGRLMQALEENGLADRTVVVFWSDHGFHLGQHSLWCKTSDFELDARVPLIVRPPKYARAGSRTRGLVELVDLYPSLAELCDLDVPEGLEGTSFAPLLDDPSRPWKKAAFTQHPRPAYYRGKPDVMGYSMRTDRFRYTEWQDWKDGGVVARELYDHQNDPDETVNLAGRDEFRETVDALQVQLKRGWSAAVPQKK
ncbi:Arylsulfatase [Maioricimonas rarisocia]|uniref:Arylsulfatase n=1 Tax=Maioricimonas rarisocia TaxID=2528026 RepID=A0A517Z703_9PLAN|nr:Arylsulfatase [Maioricimonas rarisocia]